MTNKQKTHWHFKFMAFNQMIDNGAIKLGTEITIISGDSEADALDKAKKKVTRKSYWTKEAWECTSCFAYESQVAAITRQAESSEAIAKYVTRKFDI